MAQTEATEDVVSASCGGGDGGGSVVVDIAGDKYVTAVASTSMASCSDESSVYATAGLSEVQTRAMIEKSKDEGWSEVAKVGMGQVGGAGPLSAADALAWKELQNKYFYLFRDDVEVKLGRLIAEGGQAQIYEVEDIGSKRRKCRKRVAKVFKRDGFSLAEFRRHWPLVTSRYGLPAASDMIGYPTFGGYLSNCSRIQHCQYLEDGRFAFVMERYWGDLRTLINLQLKKKNYQGLPFSDRQAVKIMVEIARGIYSLHGRGTLHRDLKAANVLIKTSQTLNQPDQINLDKEYGAHVADFESSMLVQGTGFWRAPEVLKELQKPRPSDRNPMIWTEKVDMYSYAMTCYEILTGLVPFLGYQKSDWDRIIVHGERPHVPDHVNPKLKDVLERCWPSDPSNRPTFAYLCRELDDICREEGLEV